jgi:hypothetical protein
MKTVVQIGVRRSSMNFYCRNKQSEEAAVIAKERLISGQVLGDRGRDGILSGTQVTGKSASMLSDNFQKL